MTLRTKLFVTTLIPLFLGTATATAQSAEGFSLNRFQPSERGSEWFAADSLDLRGKNRLALGVVGDWAHRPLVIYDENGDYKRAPISNQLVLHLGAAITFADRLRIGANLPIYAVNRGVPGIVDGVRYEAKEGGTTGDLRLGFDVRLYGKYGDKFTTAAGLQLHLPTGNQDAYASDGKVRVVPRWLFAGDIGAFTYAGQLGFDGRFRTEDYGGTAFGPELTYTAAAGVRVANKKVVLGPELHGSTVVSDGGDGFFGKLTSPVELLIGGHGRVGDFQIGAGAGPGISRGIGTPDVRVVASLVWFPEPAKPQVVVPPTDRDGDGITDALDACPDAQGPKSDDPNKNGCPIPPDADKDGFFDDEDACPDVAGVKSDDPKKNGCPVPKDTDSDGIIDDEDACPNVAGVKSEDPKKNGCPLPKDTDGDGITDDRDACVNDSGPASTDPKKHGCPKVMVEAGEVKILERIEFDTNQATIRPESNGVLKGVADILGQHIEIKKIQVQGHTDNKGSKDLNKQLSARRAAAVVTWLTKQGIDAKRLESKGFGQEQPIGTNDTEEGRQNNRRVQFIILQTGEGDGASTVTTDAAKPAVKATTKPAAKPEAKPEAKPAK